MEPLIAFTLGTARCACYCSFSDGNAISEYEDITCNEAVNASNGYCRRMRHAMSTDTYKRYAGNTNITLLQSIYSKSGNDEDSPKRATDFSHEEHVKKSAGTRNVNCSSNASQRDSAVDETSSFDSCQEDETWNIFGEAHGGSASEVDHVQNPTGNRHPDCGGKASNETSKIDKRASSFGSCEKDITGSINDEDRVHNRSKNRSTNCGGKTSNENDEVSSFGSSSETEGDGEDEEEEQSGGDRAGSSLVGLLERGLFAEVCRQLQNQTEHMDDVRFKRAKVIDAQCVEALSQISGMKISDYLVNAKSASGVEWGYTITDDSIRLGSCSDFDAGMVEVVAGLLEFDVQGHDPVSQSARWKNRRRNSFQNWVAGETTQSVGQRRPSLAAVVPPIRGMRDDIVYVEELGGIGKNPLDSVWNLVLKNPITNTVSDDVIVATCVNLLDEPSGGVMILAKPAQCQGGESIEVPPPRPGHDRSEGIDVIFWIQPKPAGGCRVTMAFDVKMSDIVRKLARWIPGFVMQRLLTDFIEQDYIQKSAFFKSLQLARTMEREPRASFYKNFRAHVRWHLSGAGDLVGRRRTC